MKKNTNVMWCNVVQCNVALKRCSDKTEVCREVALSGAFTLCLSAQCYVALILFAGRSGKNPCKFS